VVETVLIANRGAIATRIIRTLKIMGLRSVAVYAEADRESLHVQHADEAVELGAGGAEATYLNQDRLLEIARRSGSDAVHPGYGFLSENAAFVDRCEAAGLSFLGPTAEQIRAFGLKHRARELAGESQVPLLPGSGLLASVEVAASEAQRIGYPVMLKSTAGGGGIGMRLCRSPDELSRAFAAVARLSRRNFADDGLFLEKYIDRARHVEVQVFGDGAGDALSLGVRDCSPQRRNQKVLEETPAPGLSSDLMAEMEATARRLAASVSYRSAGTVEFVLDVNTHRYYFLEVNTRLQVEHGVTESLYGVDLVNWMVMLAQGTLPPLQELCGALHPAGHSIQARLYAEDPHRDFRPCAGRLTRVRWPDESPGLRIDHWLETGQEVSAAFDPMLAKVIVHGRDRADALDRLKGALAGTELYGVETNRAYLQRVLAEPAFREGRLHTRLLEGVSYQPASLEVLDAGTLTTVQDHPGRQGYWDVGVPPSGPFDDWSFRLGNRLLGNATDAAGLEITLNGPTLTFNCDRAIVLAGATIEAWRGEQSLPMWQVVRVRAGDTLRLGSIRGGGSRSYLLVAGGLDCPQYLGSRATFTLGRFGGHNGRALQAGDVLHLQGPDFQGPEPALPAALRPVFPRLWEVHVIYGPHGAPDFFTPEDIHSFFTAHWEVHYNSSRTGIRLLGPKPRWARGDGGEAGLHPSNIHDNAYAIGTVDFTGDMPVILGPDGPSLGGFVCPATVIAADRWKLGQLRAGDRLRFVPVTMEHAVTAEAAHRRALATLSAEPLGIPPKIVPQLSSPVLATLDADHVGTEVVYRPAGDNHLLVEYGAQRLDIELRCRVHALMLWLQRHPLPALRELTPGVRSLQIHYDSQNLALAELLAHLRRGEYALDRLDVMELPSRIVHLPLSWDDPVCGEAIDRYHRSVRPDAPWYPSNMEFIRRINGLDSIESVRRTVFDASYLVMGLGDVYLGAPVATPLDPRHRLVTTKYNPARTWTAENSVGIGGAYLCVYGMEGPGGYQLFGRTLQMWNRDRLTAEFQQPWLLRFFDQIRFFPVSAEELMRIRRDFPRGRYPLRIQETTFSLRDYRAFLQDHRGEIDAFTGRRDAAFRAEVERWRASGQFHYEAPRDLGPAGGAEEGLPENCMSVDSQVSGSVWQWLVSSNDRVRTGQPLAILESMKMEIQVLAPRDGRIHSLRRDAGTEVSAGQSLLWLEASER
jgi:urea carboxylase